MASMVEQLECLSPLGAPSLRVFDRSSQRDEREAGFLTGAGLFFVEVS